MPSRPDGKLRISDADFAVQYNLGVMIEPWENPRIGLRYLTETDLNFKDAPDVSGQLVDANFDQLDLGLTMPRSIIAGLHHQLNDDWAVLGSLGWEEWSKFGKPKVELKGLTPDVRIDGGFRDTWHFGVGTEYQYNPRLMLTAGVVYDTSMMTDAITGCSLTEADTLIEATQNMFSSDQPVKNAQLTEITALEGVRSYPSRIKCATLAWTALAAALHGQASQISTE